MNKKRIVGVTLAVGVCGVLALAGTLLSRKSGAVVLDQAGNEIAKLTVQDGKIGYECEEEYQSYADIVSQEAVKMIQEREGVNEETAAKILADKEITVETWLDQETLDAVIASYNDGEGMSCDRFGAAVSDGESHLTACYSDTKGNDNYNNVTKSAFAGSTMKPLSVYGPAVEDGTICWSSLYEDTAYGVMANENGIAKEWPQNVVPFTGEKVTVADAVKESNNTVAVKVLKDYGVEKSVCFLDDALGYDVDNEKKLLENEGEDRILSNIALGYLENGVTVAKMTDAYQVFINEGVDTPLCAVKEIKKSGETYWTPKQKETEVFSAETAYIMNRMLREVVTDGTGISAQVKGLDLYGKTGTSEYGDHWFVGTIPENVCAVWYKSDKDAETDTADAARIWKGIFEKIGAGGSRDYPVPDGVKEEVYCRKSGLLAGDRCKETGVGYYKEGTFSELCKECQ
ncbi:penicillin-binding transpeptidase domain-containing protein [Mediterraneibacter sp.]|jgi:membrane peptidoglycan carboxypeptidase|uniref:penicillin-binding transpeptidase domain-containing protein n=1 Tax=Mediterraneibacter sp. TaxID=2316022 RepID=UPI0015B2AB0D|nr:penicillin-binding transpeptidase domain-containing protein [Mediterraneibacter sp.]